ncbi:hypothetical protein MMC26_004789 [Xylographa opegraphella]|nr:hypothetical protein [Xylographa opegraphella]
MASPPVEKPENPGRMDSQLMAEPGTPVRTSSERRVSEPSLDELVFERDKLAEQVKQLRKQLELGLTYDTLRYWAKRTGVQRKLSEHTTIQKKISLLNFKQTEVESEETWEKSPNGLALLEREKAYAL